MESFEKFVVYGPDEKAKRNFWNLGEESAREKLWVFAEEPGTLKQGFH